MTIYEMLMIKYQRPFTNDQLLLKIYYLKALRKNSYEILSKLCKTNPILCVFHPKTPISPKNKPNSNPIQSQFNPKQTQFNPIQSQKQTQSCPPQADSNPIFRLLGCQSRNNSGAQRQKGWQAGKRRGRLRREFKMRSKPHHSTIAGLMWPVSVVASFKVGMWTWMTPVRVSYVNVPGRRGYDYFVGNWAAVVFPDKGAAGNRDCHYGNYDGNY